MKDPIGIPVVLLRGSVRGNDDRRETQFRLSCAERDSSPTEGQVWPRESRDAVAVQGLPSENRALNRHSANADREAETGEIDHDSSLLEPACVPTRDRKSTRLNSSH